MIYVTSFKRTTENEGGCEEVCWWHPLARPRGGPPQFVTRVVSMLSYGPL